MKKFFAKLRQYPIAAGVAASLMYLLLNYAFGYLFSTVEMTLPVLLISELVFMAWPLALLFAFGQGHVFRWGSMRKGFREGAFLWVVYGVMLMITIVVACNEPATSWKTPVEMALGVLSLIGVGLREEAVFRGIVTDLIARKYARTPKGVYLSVFTAGFLFGAIHLYNLTVIDNVMGVVIQTITAWMSGCVFCVLLMRGSSLLNMMLLHALVDAAGLFEASFTYSSSLATTVGSYTLQNLMPAAVMLIITLCMLRKKKMNEIVARYQHADVAA